MQRREGKRHVTSTARRPAALRHVPAGTPARPAPARTDTGRPGPVRGGPARPGPAGTGPAGTGQAQVRGVKPQNVLIKAKPGFVLWVIALGALAVPALWWHDTTIPHGLGAWLTGAGRI